MASKFLFLYDFVGEKRKRERMRGNIKVGERERNYYRQQ